MPVEQSRVDLSNAILIDHRPQNGTERARGGVGRCWLGGNHLFFPAAASSAISLRPILKAQHFGLHREMESVNNFVFFSFFFLQTPLTLILHRIKSCLTRVYNYARRLHLRSYRILTGDCISYALRCRFRLYICSSSCLYNISRLYTYSNALNDGWPPPFSRG